MTAASIDTITPTVLSTSDDITVEAILYDGSKDSRHAICHRIAKVLIDIDRAAPCIHVHNEESEQTVYFDYNDGDAETFTVGEFVVFSYPGSAAPVVVESAEAFANRISAIAEV